MPGAKVIPPPPLVDKRGCLHKRANEHSFRCPDCRGIMRRCCQSIVAFYHEDSCEQRFKES